MPPPPLRPRPRGPRPCSVRVSFRPQHPILRCAALRPSPRATSARPRLSTPPPVLHPAPDLRRDLAGAVVPWPSPPGAGERAGGKM